MARHPLLAKAIHGVAWRQLCILWSYVELKFKELAQRTTKCNKCLNEIVRLHSSKRTGVQKRNTQSKLDILMCVRLAWWFLFASAWTNCKKVWNAKLDGKAAVRHCMASNAVAKSIHRRGTMDVRLAVRLWCLEQGDRQPKTGLPFESQIEEK